jgi:hypothetical protein
MRHSTENHLAKVIEVPRTYYRLAMVELDECHMRQATSAARNADWTG